MPISPRRRSTELLRRAWFVSRATKYGVPDDLNSVMLRLHAPDPLGFMRDRAVARFGTKRMVDEYIAVYNRIVEAHRARP